MNQYIDDIEYKILTHKKYTYPFNYLLGFLSMARDISHRAAFESHGETYVRVLAQQDDEIGRQAVAWLAEQQSLRDEAASAKRDAREEETLSIARKASSSANRANLIAWIAAVIAALSIIKEIIIGVFKWATLTCQSRGTAQKRAASYS